jgi:hypothetical protein
VTDAAKAAAAADDIAQAIVDGPEADRAHAEGRTVVVIVIDTVDGGRAAVGSSIRARHPKELVFLCVDATTAALRAEQVCGCEQCDALRASGKSVLH